MRLGKLAVVVLLAAVATVAAPATAAQAEPFVARHVRNVNSGLCLTARFGSGERPVVQTTCDFTVGDFWPDQYWNVNDTGPSAIIRTNQPLCVATRGAGESAAVATTCGGYPDAQWIALFPPGPQRLWQFQNVNSKLCLAARGSGESRVVQTTCDFTQPGLPYWPDQHWEVF